ncbi:MAG: ABC transporter substrate-binding protein [Microbacterium sp.]|uniref:ABC transporter substrate-binding protein n=1 Tax=Microbacterium sp. TaxID=51671 RepID=UPI002724FA7D|nr:ABC transporter substrate-binding protein [Microbacterium sp.]MDO8383877.1 ABC transporter substrate-binding protein [Microbacterium sp.]
MARIARRTVAASAAILISGIALTACAGSADPAESAGESTVKVGYLEIADTASFFLADDQGYFEDNGIKIEGTVFSAGAAVMTGLQSGDLDVGFVAVLSALQATEQGVEGQCLSGSQKQPSPDSTTQLMVAPGEADKVTSGKDLEGKNVAVNSLGNIMQLQASEWIEETGGDPSTVNWVVMGFADMPAALDSGSVDAATVVEPAITLGTKAGIPVLDPRPGDAGGYADVVGSCWFALNSWIEAHEEEATAFATGIQQGAEFFDEDPEYLRSILPDWTGTTPELASEIILPVMSAALTADEVEVWQTGGLKFGLLKNEIDPSTLIFAGNPANG